ncbi:MAG: hypothetical protein V2A73_07860 [Pseudomonadota bacterium]
MSCPVRPGLFALLALLLATEACEADIRLGDVVDSPISNAFADGAYQLVFPGTAQALCDGDLDNREVASEVLLPSESGFHDGLVDLTTPAFDRIVLRGDAIAFGFGVLSMELVDESPETALVYLGSVPKTGTGPLGTIWQRAFLALDGTTASPSHVAGMAGVEVVAIRGEGSCTVMYDIGLLAERNGN